MDYYERKKKKMGPTHPSERNFIVSLFSFYFSFSIFLKGDSITMATTRRELERTYQKKVIDKIKDLLPGCIALKNDSSYIQGFPDWTILYGNRWAVLEIKRSIDAIHQPNQDYYIDILNDMGYASFIFPENEEDVLIELYSALQS